MQRMFVRPRSHCCVRPEAKARALPVLLRTWGPGAHCRALGVYKSEFGAVSIVAEKTTRSVLSFAVATGQVKLLGT